MGLDLVFRTLAVIRVSDFCNLRLAVCRLATGLRIKDTPI